VAATSYAGFDRTPLTELGRDNRGQAVNPRHWWSTRRIWRFAQRHERARSADGARLRPSRNLRRHGADLRRCGPHVGVLAIRCDVHSAGFNRRPLR
jgi:hypothetical protein